MIEAFLVWLLGERLSVTFLVGALVGGITYVAYRIACKVEGVE